MTELIKPNFLIVGAAKCGTTTLVHWLKSHPDVFIPWQNEPSFFSVNEFRNNYKNIGEYLSLFSKATTAKAIGEKSTMYLYNELAPINIKKHLGNKVKIIIMLRDPVQMSYSLWRQNVRNCVEPLSFEEALAKEEDNFKSRDFRLNCLGEPAGFFYTRRALFSPQVKRYLEQFPRENILFVKLDDLSENPENTYRTILEFLGLDYYSLNSFTAKNVGSAVRSALLHDIIFLKKHVPSLLIKPYKLIPEKIRHHLWQKIYLWNLWSKKPDPLPPLEPGIEARLREFFSSDLIVLEKIAGLNLSNWISNAQSTRRKQSKIL